jgi:hypothetical protein
VCDPVSLFAISASIAGVQAGATIYNQQQQADFQKDLFRVNKQAANENALAGYAALARRDTEEHIAATQAIQQNANRAAAARGTARVAAAESGVSGNSAEAVIDEFTRSELDYQQAVIRRKTFADAQLMEQKRAVRSGQQAAILSALPTITGPDYLGAALRLGEQVAGAYYQNTTYSPSTGKRTF